MKSNISIAFLLIGLCGSHAHGEVNRCPLELPLSPSAIDAIAIRAMEVPYNDVLPFRIKDRNWPYSFRAYDSQLNERHIATEFDRRPRIMLSKTGKMLDSSIIFPEQFSPSLGERLEFKDCYYDLVRGDIPLGEQNAENIIISFSLAYRNEPSAETLPAG